MASLRGVGQSKLKQAAFYQGCKWAEQHRESLERDRPTSHQVAVSMTKALGFEITVWNVKTILKTVGVNLKPPKPEPEVDEERASDIDALLDQLAQLERKIARLDHLRVMVPQLEGRVDHLEEQMSRRQASLNGVPAREGEVE